MSGREDEEARESIHRCCHTHGNAEDELRNTLSDISPRTRALLRPYMCVDVTFNTRDGKQIHFYNDLLLDTGSLDGSYIGSGVLRDNPTIIRGEKEYQGTVYMADSKSRLKITRKVLLDMEVESLDGAKHHFSAWFCVLGEAYQMILGYPQLTQLPGPFFQQRFDTACKTIAHQIRDLQRSSAIRVPENRAKYQKRTVPNYLKKRIDKQVRWQLDFQGRADMKHVIMAAETDTETAEHSYRTDQELADYVEGETYRAWSHSHEPPPEEFLDLQEEHAVHFMEQEPNEALQQYLQDLESFRDLPPPKPGEEKTAPLGLFSKNEEYIKYMREVAWQVFVPQNWNGIKVEPISLTTDDDLPKARYARGRPPPKKLEQAAQAEIQRLLKYMYVPSKSPWMSDNVWAAKATAPFVRSCGDYRWVNEHIRMQHAYIPDVREELAKLKDFRYFCDFDLTNAFHQFRLDDKTSELLSIMTINGPIRPLFMPEGISPASAILQTHVREIFQEFATDSLIMFDNLTIGANTLDELFQKQKKFFDTCMKYNIFLKFSKSYFGVESIKFFGYIADGNGYRYEDSRIKALTDIQFPETGTEAYRRQYMQMFNGTSNFISPVRTPQEDLLS